MELWIASGNKGKIREFKSILMDKGIDIHAQNELAAFYPPPETGNSFLENAQIKARALHSVKNKEWVVSEDSGLEVFGLNNLPGIHSARYAGDNASDDENNAKLLKMLKIRSPLKREARFICVMVAISPEGKEFVVEGEIQGRISEKLKSGEGFGYDFCFIPQGEEKTFSELGLAFKNKVSHRSQAIKKLAEVLVP
ncbi:MAG: RdgB/HAM1 family non-canonical purine NTP pyrophosphatase [Bdellovibrionales bacterium]|nr:RdgB/HAM1 family non-canonical purine NTP pyrophosphatase [Bdellovibrionales bacterium]